MNEAIETMQRIYKGVHGKLADLCRPIQKKYALAVTVAAGRSSLICFFFPRHFTLCYMIRKAYGRDCGRVEASSR